MRKIHIILICAAFLFLFASTAVTQITRETMTNAVVLEMVKAGVPESSIVLKIQASEPRFDTSARALIELSKQGVGQKILDAMLKPEGANRVSQIKPNVQSNSKNEIAATINGKVIKMEDVDHAVKQQAQGQEAKMSPLELAAARLQVLQSLIEQEVMFQKADVENLVPNDEKVTAEVNKQKAESRLSAKEFAKQMDAAGYTEAVLRENTKRSLAIQKLIDRITSRIENSSDAEIEAFFRGNPEMFVKKRGVRLAAIVIDPSGSALYDLTRNTAEADQKTKEVIGKLSQPGSDFASLAREYSEDPSKLQGGDLGYLSEQELKQNFGELVAVGFMNRQFKTGNITNPIMLNGKRYIFKLQERVEKDETLMLRSPDVRSQINEQLVNNRKQLLTAAYQAIAMNEARIENVLAKQIVDNPNGLSGARPMRSRH